MYLVTDVQTNEVEEMYLDELVMFANDLYWDDEDADFEDVPVDKVIQAIEGCDYLVEEVQVSGIASELI